MTAPPQLEIVNAKVCRGRFRAVLFDFDGTLSLIREGWPRVMVGMMVERLRAARLLREPEADEWRELETLVMSLNGEPTIRQMEAFAAETRRRGGVPDDSSEYLREYLQRLMSTVRQRWAALESGAAHPSQWVVHGTHAILDNLRGQGAALHVASGTDHADVAREARLLKVEPYFPNGIDAPRGNSSEFSKRSVIESLLERHRIRGEELLGFGDGVVETREVKRVGGVAVGVASCEPGAAPGQVDPDKRDRLIAAGADLVIADYRGQAELLHWLWGKADE